MGAAGTGGEEVSLHEEVRLCEGNLLAFAIWQNIQKSGPEYNPQMPRGHAGVYLVLSVHTYACVYLCLEFFFNIHQKENYLKTKMAFPNHG